MALWGGRFEQPPDALFKRLNDSLPFDYRLLPQDIAGSIAWAGAIHRAGVLTADEHARLVEALRALARETEADPARIVPDGDEDVHSWVERRLVEALGPLGKKLHTGRSRNDQVATDLRLFVMDAIARRRQELREARAALLRLARREQRTVIAGYTHLQRAQPVLLPHWCLAYFEMLDRDDERFAGALLRTRMCPLGSGALAGTAYAIDRDALARELGFDAPSANSLDAVSDRDFVLETLGAASITALHLSRLAEDLIVYSSGEFAFLTMGDAVSSGSSLMPQKKNPDVP
ncbi:MAG TPA: argininosuccinate lyase, partial [Phycisphaerales bacterium]|nr:argininosuccinate lyase [Phycisphaerales bacterium]